MPMQVNIKQCFWPAFEQKKRQKRKIEDDLDDMEIEPQMKYKGDTFTCKQFLRGGCRHGGSAFLCVVTVLF